jgi:hypothetical protein
MPIWTPVSENQPRILSKKSVQDRQNQRIGQTHSYHEKNSVPENMSTRIKKKSLLVGKGKTAHLWPSWVEKDISNKL